MQIGESCYADLRNVRLRALCEPRIEPGDGRIEELTMEWATIVIAVVTGIVAVVAVPVWAVQWGGVRRAQADARVKQDMLARGLSVEEIERLLKLSSVPAVPPRPPPASRPSEAALALASAVESMVAAEKDTDEIAAFLDAFLRRQGGPQETSREPNQPLHLTGGA
jgi:hypothetical protein